jgi:TolA-binding protein
MFVAIFSILLVLPHLSAADMVDGLRSYQAGDYVGAAQTFRVVMEDATQTTHHGDAALLLAKSYLNLADLDQAEDALGQYLDNHSGHKRYDEGSYLKGRLLYLQGEYQSSIIALQSFIKAFPSSAYVPNGYYWIGEALFSLGQIDEAAVLFRAVVQDYPESAKAEAARYRSSLIDLHKREAELLELLKLSHQETLKAIEDFERREQTYQQSIADYQRRLSSNGSDSKDRLTTVERQLSDRNNQIASLEAQVDALRQQLADANITAVQTDSAVFEARAPDEIALRTRLLEAKEKALELKLQLINALRTEAE